jgi:rod shape determining protein RodA
MSGFYAALLAFLVLIQPDFGSAIIIALIWFGMVLVSGISKKHLIAVLLAGALLFGGLWSFAFEDYQKDRIRTFLNPLTDLQGTGYNAYQSTVAVGSGELLGKGVGYGTQSKLKFLPEYETDFIFAAFAEEWGFIGVALIFLLFSMVILRIVYYALHGATNFESFFAVGVAIFFLAHFVINVGMNIGLLPITGTTVPFLSYGGSHLVTEFAALGILMGMRRYSRAVHRDSMENEIVGVV